MPHTIFAARLVFSIAGLALSMATAATQAQTTSDFSGDYRMQGKGFGANDAAYQGTCAVKRDGPGYEVSCFNRDTRHTYVGKGLAIGDTFSVFIGDTLRGDHNAVFAGEYLVAYRKRPDGVLEGTWLHATTRAAGAETLTPAH